jgi:hypothetical protein
VAKAVAFETQVHDTLDYDALLLEQVGLFDKVPHGSSTWLDAAVRRGPCICAQEKPGNHN